MRELRGGLKGFRIFIACLALGVMVIAAVGALADALRAGLASQGETILAATLHSPGCTHARRPRSRTSYANSDMSARRRRCARWRGGSMAPIPTQTRETLERGGQPEEHEEDHGRAVLTQRALGAHPRRVAHVRRDDGRRERGDRTKSARACSAAERTRTKLTMSSVARERGGGHRSPA